jgi:hypothetical protein
LIFANTHITADALRRVNKLNEPLSDYLIQVFGV